MTLPRILIDIEASSGPTMRTREMKRNRFTEEQDHLDIEEARGRSYGFGTLLQERCQRCQYLQVESQVWRHGRV